MNILLLGSGGREHAMAHKIAASELCTRLFIAPGNAGTALVGTNVALNPEDFEAVGRFVLENQIEMVVVGPEAPLVGGIADYFAQTPKLNKIPFIGPSQKGAQLEGSKDYAKDFMTRHNIPTAAHRTFTRETLQEGLDFLKTLKAPYVLKADGLAAGKGVLILDTLADAKKQLTEMLQNAKFGNASAKVVIEEYLDGIEMSLFVLTDGKHYQLLPEAKDYKRIGEHDTGLNTGGMGSVSPVPFADKKFMEKVEERIVKPTVKGLFQEQIPYKGFIFVGLMAVQGPDGLDPYVIEYNVRMGDPETESVFPRIKSDIVSLFQYTWEGDLQKTTLEIDPRAAACVMLTAEGYPEHYEKGHEITGVEEVEGSLVFHAGTKTDEQGRLVTNGGRVMCVTSLADNIPAALLKSYQELSKIHWDGLYFRRDIGQDILKLMLK